MKWDVKVEGPGGKQHGFRVPYEGMLQLLTNIRDYEAILGPGLEQFHPKVVAIKPQLALPHYA